MAITRSKHKRVIMKNKQRHKRQEKRQKAAVKANPVVKKVAAPEPKAKRAKAEKPKV